MKKFKEFIIENIVPGDIVTNVVALGSNPIGTTFKVTRENKNTYRVQVVKRPNGETPAGSISFISNKSNFKNVKS